MTSETLNGIGNFTSNSTFDSESTNVDWEMKIDALNVRNCDDELIQQKFNGITYNAASDSNSHTEHRRVEKLRIVISTMASTTASLQSSSSVRPKKNKKRFCKKGCKHFKHKADFLEHCAKHQELVTLERLNLNDPNYRDFKTKSIAKLLERSRSPNETTPESLKIGTFSANFMKDSHPSTPAATHPQENECRIRVLRPEEIIQRKERDGFRSPTTNESIQEIDSLNPPPMYGQPPLHPIHQMENLVQSLGGIGPMMNRPQYPPMPPNYPIYHNYPMPPSRPKHSNQPINIASFIETIPDMFNSEQIDDANKTPHSSAEATVQKLQSNNLVSIDSEKVSASPSTSAQSSSSQQTLDSAAPIANENDIIDLSIDNNTPVMTVAPTRTDTTKSKLRLTILKCPIKKCEMRFSNVSALHNHLLRVHQLTRI